MARTLLLWGFSVIVIGIGINYTFPGYVSLLKFAPSALLGFSDGREQDCLNFVKTNAQQGNATDVLRVIDIYGWNHQFLMNVGDDKGEILSAEVRRKNPKHALEIGAYVGYSATRISSDLLEGSHLTSVEFSSFNANIARQVVDYAGLTDKVTIVEGTVTTVLKEHMEKTGIDKFDFVFVDHEKTQYLPDLKYLLQEGLLRTGAVVVGDNIVFPGAPDYREFVNTSPLFKTVEHVSNVEYLSLTDVVAVSIYVG